MRASGRPHPGTRGLWDPEALRDGENVLLVPPGDPDALAAAVGRVLADASFGGRDRPRRARVGGGDSDRRALRGAAARDLRPGAGTPLIYGTRSDGPPHEAARSHRARPLGSPSRRLSRPHRAGPARLPLGARRRRALPRVRAAAVGRRPPVPARARRRARAARCSPSR